MLIRGLSRVLSQSLRARSSCWPRRLTTTITTSSSSSSSGKAVVGNPSKDGFFAPAEFNPHTRCLVGWAWDQKIWPSKAEKAKQVVLEVVRRIIEDGEEDVALICDPDQPCFTSKEWMKVRDLMDRKEHKLAVWPMKVDWCYLRDTAPTFVVSKISPEVRGVAWTFTEYGYMLPRWMWQHDATLAKGICDKGSNHCYKSVLDVEGGAIAFNGAGTVITTESVLLDKCRNAGRLKNDVEQDLKDYLGCNKVIWLEKGLPYDDTGGHVDNVAAFVSDSAVVLAWIDEDRDPDLHRSLNQAKHTLESHGLTVHKLHLPDQLFRTPDEYLGVPSFRNDLTSPGINLPGSYVNFYIANKAVVMPKFDQPHWDEEAEKTLTKLFEPSGRKVVGVSSRELLLGGGNIHCLTQQVPASPKL